MTDALTELTGLMLGNILVRPRHHLGAIELCLGVEKALVGTMQARRLADALIELADRIDRETEQLEQGTGR